MAFVSPISLPCRPYAPNLTSLPRSPLSSPSPIQLSSRSRPVFRCTWTATAANEAEAAKTTDTTSGGEVADSSQIAPPPTTFFQAITQAQSGVDAAISAGFKLLEVEFPPLPTSQLESAAVSAYDVSDANVRLAIDFAGKYARDGKRVALAFPDLVEKDRAVEMCGEKEEPMANVRFSSLRNQRKGSLIERLWTKPELDVAVRDSDDMFIVLGASCQELPDVERLVEATGDRPVILFNLKLDSARGDLGLPAFPRKDMHYRFLSTTVPVYYLRTRTYSRSIRKAPYIVNYSGALFRVYPGPYQVLLDTSRGSYNRLVVMEERPALGEVRDYLTDGMNLNDGEQKGNSIMFKGYKSKTWWEEDRSKAISNNWRS